MTSYNFASEGIWLDLLSQCELRFTPALHFVSSPVKLLSKTHQEMDFLQDEP